jgi:alkylation response protein AidB-like acyl-CoA dehydrogenase
MADGSKRVENTVEGQKALRAALMAKTTALVPLLRAKAAETERGRRIPDEVLAAMDTAGLFRMRAPRRFGGLEADLRTYMDVITELGRGCGSTAWISFISIATAWIAPQFPDQAQRDVFEGNPDARTIGVLAMTVPARPSTAATSSPAAGLMRRTACTPTGRFSPCRCRPATAWHPASFSPRCVT